MKNVKKHFTSKELESVKDMVAKAPMLKSELEKLYSVQDAVYAIKTSVYSDLFELTFITLPEVVIFGETHYDVDDILISFKYSFFVYAKAIQLYKNKACVSLLICTDGAFKWTSFTHIDTIFAPAPNPHFSSPYKDKALDYMRHCVKGVVIA